jgi:hypothetical protein
MVLQSTKKTRKRKPKTMKVIALSLSIALIEHLQDLCRRTAIQEGKTCTMSRLVRDTLMQAYPPPKQTQLEMTF